MCSIDRLRIETRRITRHDTTSAHGMTLRITKEGMNAYVLRFVEVANLIGVVNVAFQ